MNNFVKRSQQICSRGPGAFCGKRTAVRRNSWKAWLRSQRVRPSRPRSVARALPMWRCQSVQVESGTYILPSQKWNLSFVLSSSYCSLRSTVCFRSGRSDDSVQILTLLVKKRASKMSILKFSAICGSPRISGWLLCGTAKRSHS